MALFQGRDRTGTNFDWFGFGSASSFVMGTREAPKGDALDKGGITSSSSSQEVVAENTSRTVVEVSNGGTTGVWLGFGAAAVAGEGTYLPPGSTGYWPTTAAVNAINAAGGSNGAVGYTEW